MSYTVSVNHPHFPEGTEISIGGIGAIPNGGSKEVDEEEERAFLNMRGLPLDEGFANDAAVKVTGSGSLDKSEIDEVKAYFAPEVETQKEAQPNEASGAKGRSAFASPTTPEEEEGSEE